MKEEIQVKTDRTALVVRHNKLIESKHTLSLPERRFMLWIVSQIRKEDKDLHTYRISVSDFVEFAGLEKNDSYYPRIVALADKLVQKSLGIKDKEKRIYEAFSWFHHIKYKWGEGVLEATLHPNLKPYLLQLKEQYTAITLEYAMLLRSSYSHRIYDLLKQYESIGSRTLNLTELREFMMLENRYPVYRDFRRYVLEVAQKEINEKTDISFDFKPVKSGRKIASILFTIHTKKPTVTLANREEMEPEAHRIFRKLIKYGIADKTARELISGYEDKRIKWHISEFEKRIKEGKTEGVGWLIQGIRENYEPQQSIFEKEEEKKREKAQKAREKEKQVKAKAEKLQKECSDRNTEEQEKIISGLSEEEKENILSEIKKGGRLRMWGNPKTFEELANGKAVFKYELLHAIRNRYQENFLLASEYAKRKKASTQIVSYLKSLESSIN